MTLRHGHVHPGPQNRQRSTRDMWFWQRNLTILAFWDDLDPEDEGVKSLETSVTVCWSYGIWWRTVSQKVGILSNNTVKTGKLDTERFYCAVRSKFLNILIHVQFRVDVNFGRLVASFTQRKLGFDPGPVYVRYVMDKGARGQVFLRALQFSPVTVIPQMLHSHLHLHTALTRMANGWSLGTLKKFFFVGIREALDREVLSLVLVLRCLKLFFFSCVPPYWFEIAGNEFESK